MRRQLPAKTSRAKGRPVLVRVCPSRRKVHASCTLPWEVQIRPGVVLFTFSVMTVSAIVSSSTVFMAGAGCEEGGGEEVEEVVVDGGVGKDSAEHAEGELEVKVPVQDDPANGEVVGRVKVMRGRGAKWLISFWSKLPAKLTSDFASSVVTAGSVSKLCCAGSKLAVGFASPMAMSASGSGDSHLAVQVVKECFAFAPCRWTQRGQRCHPRWHCSPFCACGHPTARLKL